MTLGDRIVALRKMQGWKQQDLVKKTGLRQSLLSHLEHNHLQSVGVEVVQKLAAAFGLPVEELTAGVEGMQTASGPTSASRVKTGDKEWFAAYQEGQAASEKFKVLGREEQVTSGQGIVDSKAGAGTIHQPLSTAQTASASAGGKQPVDSAAPSPGAGAGDEVTQIGEPAPQPSASASARRRQHNLRQTPAPPPGTAAGGELHTTLEPATVQVRRHRSHSPFEMGEAGQIVEETLTVHQFITAPARVGVRANTSIEVMQGEWRGLQVYIEKPCYVEEVEAVKEQVLREAQETAQRWTRALLDEIAGHYRTAQPDLSRVAS